MWSQKWGQALWSGMVSAVPAMPTWGLLLLGALLALGFRHVTARGPRGRLAGLVALALAAIAVPLSAGAMGPLPFTFTNGTGADANQVNANLTALRDAINQTAPFAGQSGQYPKFLATSSVAQNTFLWSTPVFIPPRNVVCSVTLDTSFETDGTPITWAGINFTASEQNGVSVVDGNGTAASVSLFGNYQSVVTRQVPIAANTPVRFGCRLDSANRLQTVRCNVVYTCL
jgi:hypothetical protein